MLSGLLIEIVHRGEVQKAFGDGLDEMVGVDGTNDAELAALVLRLEAERRRLFFEVDVADPEGQRLWRGGFESAILVAPRGPVFERANEVPRPVVRRQRRQDRSHAGTGGNDDNSEPPNQSP